MSFGRREPDSRPRPSERIPRQSAGPTGVEPSDDEEGGGKLLAQLSILAAVAGIALLAVLALPGMMSGNSSAAFRSAKVGFDGQFAPGERVSRRPALQSVMDACLPPLSEEGERKLGRRGGFYERLAAMGASSTIDAFGTYLVCSMGRERQRLCDAADRDDLLNEIGHYFARIDRERARYERRSGGIVAANSPGAQVPRFMSEMYAQIEENIKSFNGDDGISAAPPPPSGARSDVLSGIGELIAEGYISAANFGSSPPEELASALASVERRADRCK